MIERSRPDVIHVKGRLIAEVWPVLPPERTVFHIATAGARDASWTDAEVAAFRKFIERAARVFAPGAQVAKRFKREFGIERDVTPVFTMAPDAFPAMPEMRQAERGKGPLRFGYLGRFAAGKGIPEILAALQALASRGTPPPFVFAGEGPLEALIRDGITRNHLKHVTVVRVISPVTALAEMDVLVLPSESEAMPLVLVEALMCGRPCLATAVGGVPDLIRDGVEGILLADGRPETLEAGMGRFLAMPAPEVAGYRSRGRARYEERCLPGRVAAEVAGHYREIMERASRQ
jgi:glycosyltransferase involved in cell wall biosynthesis